MSSSRTRGSSTPGLFGPSIDVSGILDRPPSRTMTMRYAAAFSRRIAPELCKKFPCPRNLEGAGNAGCALHPRSHAQRAQKVRARAYRAAENIRHSLRNGFTAYNALSPVSHVLLPPSTPTSGRQDHTSLPYALAARVSRSLSVHRNPSLVVTTADALLGGTGWRQI